MHWGGPAGILGGILWLGFFVLQATAPATLNTAPYTVTNPVAYVIYNLMFLGAGLLFVITLLALYARQADRAGAVGKIGVVLAVVGGLLFMTGGVLSILFNIEGMWNVMLAGAAVLPISLIALGVSTLSTQVLERWSFVPLLIGMFCLAAFVFGSMGLFQLEPLGAWLGASLAALVGAGLILLGYALAVGRPEQPVSPQVA